MRKAANTTRQTNRRMDQPANAEKQRLKDGPWFL